MGFPEIKHSNWSVHAATVAGAYVDVTDDVAKACLLLQWIEMQHKVHSVSTVADLGCGIGFISACVRLIVPNATIWCFDKNRQLEHAIQQQFTLNAVKVNIVRKHPALDGTVDLAHPHDRLCELEAQVDCLILADVLQYLYVHPVRTLRVIAKLLARSGVCYISCPDAEHNAGKVYTHVTSYQELPLVYDPTVEGLTEGEVIWNYGYKELCRIITENGFRVTRFGYTNSAKGRMLNMAIEAQQV
jgi:hypothetical protein